MKKLILAAGAMVLGGSALGLSAVAQMQPEVRPPVRMEHPPMASMPLPAARDDRVRTAEEMRAGSGWGQYGGMGDSGNHQAVGGPFEEAEQRSYPACRNRSDDRCRQRR